MGLEMVTSISDNLNDLKTWNICMYDRLWCRVYFLHHGGGLSVPKYIMWKLKHQRSVNHYLIINKARVLNRFVNQCIAIVNFQTTHWRPWYNFMHLFISKNLEIFDTSTKFLLHEKLDVKKRAILTSLPQRMDYLQIHSIPKVSNKLLSQSD